MNEPVKLVRNLFQITVSPVGHATFLRILFLADKNANTKNSFFSDTLTMENRTSNRSFINFSLLVPFCCDGTVKFYIFLIDSSNYFTLYVWKRYEHNTNYSFLIIFLLCVPVDFEGTIKYYIFLSILALTLLLTCQKFTFEVFSLFVERYVVWVPSTKTKKSAKLLELTRNKNLEKSKVLQRFTYLGRGGMVVAVYCCVGG